MELSHIFLLSVKLRTFYYRKSNSEFCKIFNYYFNYPDCKTVHYREMTR